jgi:hypothetical protein
LFLLIILLLRRDRSREKTQFCFSRSRQANFVCTLLLFLEFVEFKLQDWVRPESEPHHFYFPEHEAHKNGAVPQQ